MRRFQYILYFYCCFTAVCPCGLAGLALVGLAPVDLAWADEPKPIADNQQYHICLGRHGGPSVLTESEFQTRIEEAPQLANYCRRELRWTQDAHWLCRLDDYVLLSDYPIDRVGIVAAASKLSELFAGKTFECRKLTEGCAGRHYLLRKKHCYQQIESYSKDYWRQFAQQANQDAVELNQPCEYKEKLEIDYAVQDVFTGCQSESCVLRHPSAVWHTALKLFNPEGVDDHDFSYFKPERVVVRSKELERKIDRPGVYCIEHKQYEIKRLSEPVYEYRVSAAEFLTGLPEAWPQDLPKMPLKVQEKNTALDSLRCKSDADCVQGKGTRVCMIKSMAVDGNTGSDPSYRCICMKGPLMFGCVSKSID